jgi:putative molybdopterin biosynthesis protein
MQTLLGGAGVPAQAVRFESAPTLGHHAAARRVFEGQADACLAPRCYAEAFGLGFVPVGEERFDLVAAADLAGDPRWLRVLETLASRPFRREVSSLGGHDPSAAATRLARLEVA